jgi:regulator of sirC expression with transglutaminase-like and TPR domain
MSEPTAPPLPDALTAPQALALLTAIGAGRARLMLAETALLLGAHGRLQTEAKISLAPYRAHLNEVAAAARARGVGLALVADRADALRETLFGRFAYAGDRDDYDNLANANLLDVIDRRRGLPVALAVLLVHAARACGWRAAGIGFPGHFLIGLHGEDGRAVIDPFTGGRLSADAVAELAGSFRGTSETFDEDLEPVPDRAMLVRLQNNLRARLTGAQDGERLLPVLEAMLALEPRRPALWLEAAELRAEAGAMRAALDAYRAALAHGLQGPDRTAAEEAVAHLSRGLN